MKILIADKNSSEKLVLCRELEQQGHEVIQAETGKEVISLFFTHNPGLVFLDVSLSDLDSSEIISRIKASGERSWVPIILLISTFDAHNLAGYIDVGGDDFLIRPIDPVVIIAKVHAFLGISQLYEKIEQQKSEIEFYNQRLIQEQEAAKKVFNNIAHRGCLDSENIHYHLSPVSIFNGDLMVAIETPVGGMRLMLADFTDHGLPAAIGAIPASEIFYGMSKKGFAITDLLVEMNARLHSILPRGVFCCLVMIDIDVNNQQATIVNAGSPQTYMIDLESENVSEIHSKHLPLGILSPDKFKVETQVFRFTPKHKLLAFTDGVTEATNDQSEMYGDDRVLDCIKSNIHKENLCENLVEQVINFSQNAEQVDDLSILEVGFPSKDLTDLTIDNNLIHAQTGSLDSNMNLCLRGQSLAKFDPVPLILQALLECRELLPYRTQIFAILSEIYNNALEHGVLGLDSKMKKSSTGFAEYYKMRSEKLAAINNGFINIEFDHSPRVDGGVIIFNFIDSGAGFDISNILVGKKNKYSGRGIKLLEKLCDSVEYFDGGHHVRATYRWNLYQEDLQPNNSEKDNQEKKDSQEENNQEENS